MMRDDILLKLSDLKQGVRHEVQHRYVDVQGRKTTFSRFVVKTLRHLGQCVPALAEAFEAEADTPSLPHLIGQFERYPSMAMPHRMSCVEGLKTWILQAEILIKPPETPQPRQRLASTQQGEAPLNTKALTTLGGIGPKMAERLSQLGIHTLEELIYYVPRTYLDYHQRKPIAQLSPGELVTVVGHVSSASASMLKNGKLALMKLTVLDGTGRLQASWFVGVNSAKRFAALKDQHEAKFPKATQVMLSGQVKFQFGKLSMDRPAIEILTYADTDEPSGNMASSQSIHAGRIIPIYALTQGLSLRFLRTLIHQALTSHVTPQGLQDPLPEGMRAQYALMPLHKALEAIHFPASMEQAENARRRLVFDELFYLQARLALMKQRVQSSHDALLLTQKPDGLVSRFLQSLPFTLTGAQCRVFSDICHDLSRTQPMYRLLHGDVGSGKTVISCLALLMAVENGYQGALMAPTEILAEQHYRKFQQWLTPLGVKVGLFVGKHGQKIRKITHGELESGQIQVAVGTHALIQDDIQFEKLAVVVVDEQHRFGVRQRSLLKSKGLEEGKSPHLLSMTATPIPRTLAMTLHGDLDVSTIDELPPGRQPIITKLTHSLREAYSIIARQVVEGRQAYVVLPLIEESETVSAKAATTEAEHLQSQVFPHLRIGLLHGKLKPDEKQAVMDAFAQGQLQVLVATTVVEVGVDVPNATVILILNAERFGLAQLHQLRGRVGRGEHASVCLLQTDSKNPETLARLHIMEETQNGFIIAEKDMEIRGPGELLGTRQSGLPDLILADLIQDRDILEQAREAAFTWVGLHSKLSAENIEYPPEDRALVSMITQKSEAAWQLISAG
jgi:ATP-dependent DNA helicase RecG